MSFVVFMVYISYYISGVVTWQPVAWRWILLVEHFDPEGKHHTKRLSLSINGCASICLLIAALEVQWDSFTVDGPDNKPWPPERVTLTTQNGCPSCETQLRRLFICWLRLGAAVKYCSIIPCRERDENKRCSTRLLTEKKKVNSHLLLFTERLSRGLFSWPGIWLFSKRIINSFVTVGVTLMLLRAH